MVYRKITGWQVLRAAIPPWKNTHDPLVSYELRHRRRAGQRPWSLLAMGYVLMLMVMFYLVFTLLQNNAPNWEEVTSAVLAILGIGLALMVMLGHWRLLMAISGRAATMIAGRKKSGDWELIAITPLDKTRWYLNQLTIIAWQVFPIIRELMILQSLLVLGGVSFLSYQLHDLSTNQSAYYIEEYLSLPLYWILILPLALLLILEPYWATALFASVSLYTSSRSKRLTMSLLYTFLNTFIIRYLITLVFYYSGLIVFFLVSNIAALLGSGTEGISLTDLFSIGWLLCGILCVYALGSSFFVEWLPALGLVMFLLPSEDGVTAVLFFSIYITGFWTYLFTPFLMLGFLGNATISQLNQREV